MNKAEFEKTNNDIEHLNKLKIDLGQNEKYSDIKSDVLKTLHSVLIFCENEHAIQNDAPKGIIFKIKCTLMSNLDFKDPEYISISLLDKLDPALALLKSYILKSLCSTVLGTTNMDNEERIHLINENLILLKKILNINVPVTPRNYSSYLTPRRYRNINEEATHLALEELSVLINDYSFEFETKNSASRRYITFLERLQEIFLKKKRLYDNTYVLKQSSGDKEEEKLSLKVNPANIFVKGKTFEEYLYNADVQFRDGGFPGLVEAKKVYAYLLETFPFHADIRYVEQQLEKIPEQIRLYKEAYNQFIAGKNMPQSESASVKKNPPHGKIDPKTGKREEDGVFG